MAALLQHPLHPSGTASASRRLPNDLRKLLNLLRFHAASCRASARLDLFEACAVLDPTAPSRTEDVHAPILLRVLGQALDAQPVFLRPGDEDVSFDEHWLIAVLSAVARADHDSFAFLVRRRVAPPKQRVFRSLVAGLATSFGKETDALRWNSDR